MNSRLLLSTVMLAAFAFATPTFANEPEQTIWRFLGIPQALKAVAGATLNRNGNRPALEPKPRVKSLADPANLEAGMPPVIQEAAKVKQQEDLKRQKIKAIKYLTQNGCGCYDRPQEIIGEDGTTQTVNPVTDALVASLQDCTEEVRLATARYITWAVQKGDCSKCGCRSCCKEEVVKQLAIIAFDIDESGCYVEPSERVREAALNALLKCCPSAMPVEIVEEPKKDPVPPKQEPVPLERLESVPAAEPIESGDEIEGELTIPNDDGSDVDSATSVPVSSTRTSAPQRHAGFTGKASSYPDFAERQARRTSTPTGVTLKLSDSNLTAEEAPATLAELIATSGAVSTASHTEVKSDRTPSIRVAAVDNRSGLVQLQLPLGSIYQEQQQFDLVRNDGREVTVARIELVAPNGTCRLIAGRLDAVRIRDYAFPR